jgi:hypothetical protein
MPTFRRVKIQAIVETPTALLLEDQVNAAVAALRTKLHKLGLAVVSVEPTEPSPVEAPAESDTDPWSMRGAPVD